MNAERKKILLFTSYNPVWVCISIFRGESGVGSQESGVRKMICKTGPEFEIYLLETFWI